MTAEAIEKKLKAVNERLTELKKERDQLRGQWHELWLKNQAGVAFQTGRKK